MDNINKRFRLFIEMTNLSPTKFASEIRVNHESVNRMFRDKAIIPSSSILISSKKRWPKLNVNHIITGEGNMFLEEIDTSNELMKLKEKVVVLEKMLSEKDQVIGKLASTVKNLSSATYTYIDKNSPVLEEKK